MVFMHEVLQSPYSEKGDLGLTSQVFAKRGTWQLINQVGGFDLGEVVSGHTDRQGRLWLRIRDALLCTDGLHVIVHYAFPELAGKRENLEGFSRDDKYWLITTDLRLISVRLEDGVVEDHTDSVPPLDKAYNLWTSPHEDIVIGIPDKIVRYDGRQATLIDIPCEGNGEARYAYIAPDGDLWVTSCMGLHFVEGDKLELLDVPDCNQEIWDFVADKGRVVWLPLNLQLLRLDYSQGHCVVTHDVTTAAQNNALFIDDENNVWISVIPRGTLCANSDGSVMFLLEDTPIHTWPTCVVQDKMQNFWFIGGGGIMRYTPLMFNLVQTGNIEQTVIGEDGKLRMAAATKGILEYDGETVRTLCGDISAFIQDLSISPEGDVYISSSKGLFVYDTKKSKLFSGSEVPGCPETEGQIICGTAWDCEECLWINSVKKLYRCEPSGLKGFTDDELGARGHHILFQDSKSRLWIASMTDQPVLRFDAGGFSVVSEDLGDWKDLPVRRFLCGFEDDEGNVWFGGGSGRLYCCYADTDTLTPVMELEGKDARIFDIRIDGRGVKWLSTNAGLYVFDDKNSYCMTEACLLPGRHVLATYEIEDGRILIATSGGICEYFPNREIRPYVFIAKVVVDKVYDNPQEKIFSERRPMVSIHLTAFNMKPGPLKYQVRMVGKNEEWEDTWKEQFHFKELPVGKYRFEARGIDQDLMTSEQVAAVDIEIIPDSHEKIVNNLKEELSEAKDFASKMMQSINDAIIVLDVDGRITRANEFALNLLGYTETDLVGKSSEFLVPSSGPHPLNFQDIERLRREGRFSPQELEMCAHGGSHVPVILSAFCLYDKMGSPEGFILAASDVSEYKALQEQMLDSQKMESLGLLARGVVHDLNNLIGTIIGYADLVTKNTEEDEECLSNITEAGTQAAKLCSQLLTYSKRGKPSKQPLDVSQIFRHNTVILKAAISSMITFEDNFKEGLPKVWGDEVQMMQIVLNLVINAVQAIGDAEGVISLSTGLREFTKDEFSKEFPDVLADSYSYVFLEVKDSGCGMDSKTLSRIFEPFFTTKYTGHGVGLSAINGIVKSHNGMIQVDSKPGEGTTFRVFLPAL